MNSSSFNDLLTLLIEADVKFILIGGVAAMAMGSTRATFDLDVVYDRSNENLDRIVGALASHSPYLRGAPAGLPFKFDRQTMKQGMNFTLTTSIGDLDLLGEVPGGVNYQDVLPDSIEIEIFNVRCNCVSLDKLIHLKRSAGRAKDLEVVSELELLRDMDAKQ